MGQYAPSMCPERIKAQHTRKENHDRKKVQGIVAILDGRNPGVGVGVRVGGTFRESGNVLAMQDAAIKDGGIASRDRAVHGGAHADGSGRFQNKLFGYWEGGYL